MKPARRSTSSPSRDRRPSRQDRIIGIGEIGGTLAARWSRNGHSVRVSNSRGPEAARPFADKIGAVAADIYGAVEGADIALLSMPFPAVATLPKDLFERSAQDVVIVDTANYFPDERDPRIGDIDAAMPESVWVSRQLRRPIVKAFNSIMFYALSELGKREGAPDRPALPVAGDDVRGKRVVMDLVNETGFDPVDDGTLEESWRQQPSTPAYCCDLWRGKDARRPPRRGQRPGRDDPLRNPGHARVPEPLPVPRLPAAKRHRPLPDLPPLLGGDSDGRGYDLAHHR
ncbi:NAD(P)-binding domain-containing protein [Hoeflea sp.]|uniref:NADPH-dependent F420 reductase n=1 Tax=Hoeflea sp. TaxID=1940281 RepID=UPI0031B8415F